MVASEHSASDESQSESPNCSGFWEIDRAMSAQIQYHATALHYQFYNLIMEFWDGK